jgi:hypothetical protein
MRSANKKLSNREWSVAFARRIKDNKIIVIHPISAGALTGKKVRICQKIKYEKTGNG